MENILNVAGITAILVFIITLLFQYFPGLRVKWAGLRSDVKSLVVLGIYLIIGATVAFGGCVAFLAQIIPQLMCADALTFIQYVFAVLVAVGAGQGIFALLPELQDVTAARSERPY